MISQLLKLMLGTIPTELLPRPLSLLVLLLLLSPLLSLQDTLLFNPCRLLLRQGQS
jgi:hypothetical protein